jgi:hypothetical protein
MTKVGKFYCIDCTFTARSLDQNIQVLQIKCDSPDVVDSGQVCCIYSVYNEASLLLQWY